MSLVRPLRYTKFVISVMGPDKNGLVDKDAPNGSSSHAFPSGHTAMAFGSAGLIQRRYGWRPGIPAYLVAAYVGWLRVETDDHDTADVAGGAAVGIISSYLLTRQFDDAVRVSAWSDGKAAGLQIRFSGKYIHVHTSAASPRYNCADSDHPGSHC